MFIRRQTLPIVAFAAALPLLSAATPQPIPPTATDARDVSAAAPATAPVAAVAPAATTTAPTAAQGEAPKPTAGAPVEAALAPVTADPPPTRAETPEEQMVTAALQEIFHGAPGEATAAAPQADSIEDANRLLARYPEVDRRKRLNLFAEAFYRLLARGDLESLKLLCDHPFHFEGRLVEAEAAFEVEWRRIFGSPRLSAAPIKRMQIFSAEEMAHHFGERPAKLAGWPVTESSYFSIGEFGGQAVVVLWRQNGDYFVAEAIHD